VGVFCCVQAIHRGDLRCADIRHIHHRGHHRCGQAVHRAAAWEFDDQSAAFLGTMLCFGTYGLAMQLRSIKVRFFLFPYSFYFRMGN